MNRTVKGHRRPSRSARVVRNFQGSHKIYHRRESKIIGNCVGLFRVGGPQFVGGMPRGGWGSEAQEATQHG